MSETRYTNYSFISYSHRDMAVAKWLQRKLEQFRLPTEVHNDIEAGGRYLRPVFRDQSDLTSGILSNELRKHLEESKYLILICSKNSADSQWVSDEAKAFVEMGRLDRIIPVVIPNDGIPEKELFPIFLRNYFHQHPRTELLGINIGEVGKEKALIRVVSKMLGVGFDSLWKRHQRHRRIRIMSRASAATAAIIATYLFAVPISVNVAVDMEEASLPMGETLALTIDGGEYETPTTGLESTFKAISIPGYRRFSDINISARCQFYNTLDTVVSTGYGIARTVTLHMTRDNTFSTFRGHVFTDGMEPIEGVKVRVGNHETTTDANGAFSIVLPIQDQRAELPISLSKPGFQSLYRSDEIPNAELRFILHK